MTRALMPERIVADAAVALGERGAVLVLADVAHRNAERALALCERRLKEATQAREAASKWLDHAARLECRARGVRAP